MIKLKKQKITNLVNYQPFLKNKKFKLKNILFENQILYKNINLESHVIEFNRYENIYLPFTLIKIDEISTITGKYEKAILFNYDLTYNLLKHFNKIIFSYTFKKKNNLIKGRLIGGGRNNKKILIAILGFIFFMKPVDLNNGLNYKKKNYFNKYNKKNFYKKKINSIRLINCYRLRYLNFKINNLNILKKAKKKISRLDYIQIILENKKILKNNLRYNDIIKSISFKKK